MLIVHWKLFILFLLWPILSQSQVFPYFLSVSQESYQEIDGGKTLQPGVVWDDRAFLQNQFPLGFSFSIGNTPADSAALGGLGAELVFFDTTLLLNPVPYFYVLGSDLADRGSLSGQAASPVSYLTQGSPGSRVFTMQWKNAGFLPEMNGDLDTTDFVNFQLRLFEGSDNIEIHFGPQEVDYPDNHAVWSDFVQIGFTESLDLLTFTAQKPMYYLSGDPSDPGTSVLSTSAFNVGDLSSYSGLTGVPGPNTVILFSKEPVSSRINYALEPLKLFPNPVRENCRVELPSFWKGKGTLEVLDNQGKILYHESITEQPVQVPVGGLSPGIYWVRLFDGQTLFTGKLIKS